MIRTWITRLATKLMDANWLRERRRQEVLSRQHTRQIEQQGGTKNWYEDELLKRLEREEGQHNAGFD